MTLQINMRAGQSAQGGPGVGLLTAAGNPWSLPDGLAQELVNRGVATAVNWPSAVEMTLSPAEVGTFRSLVSKDGILIDAGSATSVQTIPWTPAASNARLWYSAEDAQKSGGVLAASGDAVVLIPNRVAGAVSRTDSQAMPLVPRTTALGAGGAGNQPKKGAALLNGYAPVRFGAVVSGGSDDRLGTQAGALTTGGAPMAVHRVYAVMALRGTAATFPLSVSGTNGASMVSTDTSRGVKIGAATSVVAGTYTDSTPFILAVERNGSELLFQAAAISANYLGRLNGAQTSLTAAATAATSPNVALIVGNAFDVDTGADMDLYELIVVEGHMTEAERWRMEGYLAHKYGLTANLPGDHPHKSRAPVMAAGMTGRPTFDVHAVNWGYRQLVDGYLFEIQGDNIGPSDGSQQSDQSRSIPYDLVPSERQRMATDLVRGAHSIRLALGIYYRGARTINGTSSLGDTIGPRLPGQRQHIFEMVRDAGLVGIQPEYWSPAPHWKTTSAYGGGTLWAGAAYSRATTLDSIRGSDAVQYAAQITALTTAMVSDLEDLHGHPQFPMRVVGFGLQNEGADAGSFSYGSCSYTAQLYTDVMKSIIPKIRNSAILSKWGGQPNTVAIHVESLDGPLSTFASTFRSDATVLSTGKTAIQEVSGWTWHRLVETNNDANAQLTTAGTAADGGVYVAYLSSTTNPTGMPAYNNEYEWITSGTYPGRGPWFANLVTVWLNGLNWLKAPQVTLIHAAKPSTDPVSERYALASWRVPGDNGAPIDYANGLDFGRWTYNDHNFNAAKPFIQWLTGGQWLLTQETAYSATLKCGAWFRKADGKLIVAVLNGATSAAPATVCIGPETRTMRAVDYSPTQRDVFASAGAVIGTHLVDTIPARTLRVWVEV